ncbi:MAG: hypothetical protein V1793_17895 [Pseudomonadota bacterium]
MDQDELYQAWIQTRKSPGPGPGFSSRVMARIRLMEGNPAAVPVFRYGLEFLETRLLRIVFASALSAIGIFRIGYITARLLIP